MAPAGSSSSSLRLDSKTRLLSGADMWHLHDVAELGLETIMVTDGPHGLRKQTDGGIAGTQATCFPTAAGLAATWDADLVHEVGVAVARECLAEDVAVLLGPGANIKRHPLCGRNFEYFSEDPLLSGRLAAAFIAGVQSKGVGAALKHFVANNQESNRMVLDTVVDERTLHEIYLAGFEVAVRESQPWSVMCAYNRVNGTYCADNDWLLTAILRDEWGFEGLVMTDWGAVHDRVRGVRSGLDLEMPGSGGVNDRRVAEAVRSGDLDEAQLDEAVNRILGLMTRANETRRATSERGGETVDFDAHHDLAARAAAASQVLLTNDGVLPLGSSQSVALIGAFAAEPRFQGAGSSLVNPTRTETLLDALTAMAVKVTYSSGYVTDTADESNDALIAEAKRVAQQADVAVVCVGLPDAFETEGIDRSHMRLPDQHNRLVEAVVDANPNTVVVLSNGSSVELPWIDKPRAVIESYLAGQASGQGTARVLLGEVNPSGKLAETFALAHTDHGSNANFGPGRRQVQYREGVFVGYRWFDSVGTDVLFPFGHGLSYTTFAYSGLEVTGSTDANADDFGLQVSVNVQNTGGRAGAEVVQVYVRDVEASVARPDRELKGFARVELEPGASETVSVELDYRSFAFWDSGGWRVEAGEFEVLIGASSRDIRESASVMIESQFETDNPAEPPGFGGLTNDAAFATVLGRTIPVEESVRPFTADSTLGEISSNPLGSIVRRVMLAAALKMVGVKGEALNEPTRNFLEVMMDGMPLRNLVLLTEGKLSAKAVNRLARLLNRIPTRSPK